MSAELPSLGDHVIYKSKIDNGPGNDVFSPAVVIRTRNTCVPEVIDRWGPDPVTVRSPDSPEYLAAVASCPEPGWHITHNYCPGCPWTIEGDPHAATHQTAPRPEGVLAMLPDDVTVDLLVHGLGKDYREYAVEQGDGLGQWSWRWDRPEMFRR